MVIAKRAAPGYRIAGNYIEIELKPRKRTISFRIDEDVILTLDRFIASRGIENRTLFLNKILEALARGIDMAGADVKNIKLVIESESGESLEVNIPLPQAVPRHSVLT